VIFAIANEILEPIPSLSYSAFENNITERKCIKKNGMD